MFKLIIYLILQETAKRFDIRHRIALLADGPARGRRRRRMPDGQLAARGHPALLPVARARGGALAARSIVSA
eukprot:SAG31_NODE_3650_length_4028_cov_1.617205_1_plen_72_part_00